MLVSLSPNRLVLELSILSATSFAMLGLHQPFFPIWLATRGLDYEQIGLVLSVPIFLRAFAGPWITGLADRYIAPRHLLATVSALAGLGWLLLPHSPDFPILLLLVTVTVTMMLAPIPLSDVITLDALRDHHSLVYGRLRVWGSVAFMLVTLLAGQVLSRFEVTIMPALMAGFCFTTTAFATWMRTGMFIPARHLSRKDDDKDQAETKETNVKIPLSLYVLMIGIGLVGSSYAVLNSYGPVLWVKQGIPSWQIGVLTACSVIVEIAVFWWLGNSRQVDRAFNYLLIGGSAAVLRWTMMGLEPSVIWIGLLQMLHALSFALFHLGSLGMIAALAPVSRRAHVQGLFSAANALTFAGVTIFAGPWVQEMGVKAYFTMVPFALSGIALILIARRKI
jgi:PPP family 3-phenylpropionic acid transporter